MNLAFYLLLNIILISRLVFIFGDAPLSKKALYTMTLIQIFGLFLYQINWAWFILLLLLLVLNIVFRYMERRWQKINELRLMSLLIYAVLLSIFFSPWIQLDFNQQLLGFLRGLGQYSLFLIPIGKIKWVECSIVLMGGLLVLNEVNLLVRYLMKVFDLVPKKKEKDDSKKKKVDQKEYNAGRIIGLLERVIIYIAVLNNEMSAIGLILAAKGLTRFKELDKRNFAEYVLIGTLLSTLLAVLMALFIKALIL